MHWLGYNDAVSSLNEAKTRIFQPTANFENFEIRLYFVSLPASQPAVRPDALSVGLQKFHMIKVMAADLFRRRFTHCAMAIPFILLSPSLFFFIPLARCESHLQR